MSTASPAVPVPRGGVGEGSMVGAVAVSVGVASLSAVALGVAVAVAVAVAVLVAVGPGGRSVGAGTMANAASRAMTTAPPCQSASCSAGSASGFWPAKAAASPMASRRK